MELAILCIKIFLVRICDVSLGTARTIFVVKGKKIIAALIGFIEIIIWFIIVREALNTPETSLWVAVSYAGGFAVGTYIGGLVSDKFIKGSLTVQVVSSKGYELAEKIREAGYAVSVIDIKGQEDSKKCMLFIEIDKKSYSKLQNIIEKNDSAAFTVINETKYVQNGFIK